MFTILLAISKAQLRCGQINLVFSGEEETARTNGAGGQTCTILPQAMFFVDLAA